MGGIESGHFFFSRKGEIVHSIRRLGSQRRLPDWTGDESSGVESTRELRQTTTDLSQRNVGNGVPEGPVVDVKEWKPEKFDLLLRDIH